MRSFLTATGKVNRGIRDTLKSDPEKFMALRLSSECDEQILGRFCPSGASPNELGRPCGAQHRGHGGDPTTDLARRPALVGWLE